MQEGVTYNCEIIADTVANKAVAGRLKSKNIRPTKSITLKVVNISQMPNGKLLVYETNDGYRLHGTFVRMLSQKSSHKNFESEMAQTYTQTSNKPTVVLPNVDLNKKTSRAKSGVLVGGIAALILAIKYKQNKFITTALGASLGGYVGGKIK
jgi:hypothetical protein